MGRNGHDVHRVADGVVVLDLAGEHDLATVHEVNQALTALLQTSELVVVDLTHTSFLDSSMLETLVRADRTARSSGVSFRLQLGRSAIVRTAFEVTGLLDQFDVVATREEALAGFVDHDGTRIHRS
jgi:anti-sigma B factor antagonist